MARFDDVARDLTEGLDLSKRAKRRIAEEARAHMEDEMQRCLAEGMGRDEACEAAARRFGEAGALNGLIDAALARHQAYRRRRRAILGAGALLAFVPLVGAVFQAFDDGFMGVGDFPSIPVWAKMVIYLGGLGACALMLVGVAVKLFGRRIVPALVAGAVVAVAMFASVLLTVFPPLRAICQTNGAESAATLAAEHFFMRLYLCWAAALPLGALCMALRRDRVTAVLLFRALAVGALSASLWGMRLLPRCGPHVRWLGLYKWPKLASMGMFALVFVLLVAMLARTMAPRRSSAPAPEAAPDAPIDPAPSLS